MKCIIFLGHHKTGSSALQEVLTRNAHHLRDAGILYPFPEPEGAAYGRRLLAGGQVPEDLNYKVRSPHNHIAYQMMAETVPGYSVPKRFAPLPSVRDMFDSIASQVAEQSPHTLLLCSEVFSHFGIRRPELVADLLDGLGATEVTAYVTLRRPDDHIASWYGQMIKFGRAPKPLSRGAMKEFFPSSHFDFRATVLPWLQAVPRERFFVHTYAQVLAAGGSIPHFTNTVGIETSRFDVSESSANPSLKYALYKLAITGNKTLPKRHAARFRSDLITLQGDLEFEPNNRVELFGQAVRNRMGNRFAEIDAWLAGVIGQARFFEDLEAVRTVRPVPAAEAWKSVRAQARRVLAPQFPRGPIRAWLSAAD